MREREGLKKVIHFANREYKEKRPKSVKVFRVKSQTILKRGILPNLSIKQKGPIEYLVVEDRGDQLKISGFNRNGTYITDYSSDLTLRFLKTLQKNTTLEAQLPRKKIEKVEDPSIQAREKFKKIHQSISDVLGLAIEYPYATIVDTSLKFEKNRTFGCKRGPKSIHIPPDLLTGDRFELFTINELFTFYLQSILIVAEETNETLYRDLAFLVSNVYLQFKKIDLIMELLHPPVVLEVDGYSFDLTTKLKETLEKMNSSQDIGYIKLFLQFIHIFKRYQIQLSKIEFVYLFLYSCELFTPESEVNREYDTNEVKISYLCRNMFSDSFEFYREVDKEEVASKAMLLSLLFGLDYNPNLNDLMEVIQLLKEYSRLPLIQEGILKVEDLISDRLSEHIFTKQITFRVTPVFDGNHIEITLECHNTSNYAFQNFNYTIVWKPKGRLELNEIIDVKKGRDLHDDLKRSYIFSIQNEGAVQIFLKVLCVNPLFHRRQLQKKISLLKFKV